MRTVLVILMVSGLFSCQHVERPERPEDVIPLDKMADIMTDVYLANAARSVNNKVIRQNALALDSMIYKKYDIDSLQFVISNSYYTSRLDDYAEIFTAVEKRLTRLKEEYDSINMPSGLEKKPRPVNDSLGKEVELIEPARSN